MPRSAGLVASEDDRPQGSEGRSQPQCAPQRARGMPDNVDPEPAATHGLGNCTGGSGSAKGVAHHVADERVEPDQPPRQFLRECRRVSPCAFHVLRIHPPNPLRQIAVESDRDRTRPFDIARDRARLTRIAVDENVLRRAVDQMLPGLRWGQALPSTFAFERMIRSRKSSPV